MRRRALAASVVATVLLLPSCETSTATLPTATTDDAPNMPVVGIDQNSFGFAVNADHFTLDRTYDLDFSSDSTSVGLAVVLYGGGSGSVELLDADGNAIFARDLAGNIAEGSSDARTGRPVRARVRFAGYSGVVALGVDGD